VKLPISISVHNEWDPLEEVIVGIATDARIPKPDLSLHAIEYRGRSRDSIPSGPFPAQVVEEAEQNLAELAEVLASLDIVVHRPDSVMTSAPISTPDWTTSGFYNYCPRDVLLAIGDLIIEAPMALRSRSRESLAYKKILLECFSGGSRWMAAPAPRLADEIYNLHELDESALRNLEPVFDAANILRIGRDILYLVSDSGNELGARWLGRMLGEEYRVSICRNLYARTHIDSTIIVLRPGLVLLNPERVTEINLPSIFRNWDRIWCPEPVDIGYTGDAYSSRWIAMNLLMVNQHLAIVEERQLELISALETREIDVIPLRLPHARTMGGGFHCVTLDLRRKGICEDYTA
jgi:scyllo-inosamine-4-phosphate amidinotransferase 1